MRFAALLLAASLPALAANEFSNRRAPGFSLTDSRFEQHDPADYRGRVLLIEFMQTTCPICNRLADQLVQVKRKYGDKVAVLSITTLPDNYQTGDKFSAEHKITWPVLFDSGQVMMSYLKVTPANPKVGFPHLFILDKSGTIRFDFEGGEDVDQISAQVDQLLK